MGAAPGGPATTATPATGETGVDVAARFVQHGPVDTKGVALTFHGSGDLVLLDDLLGVAARMSTPITVFAVGTWLDANPGVARRILDAGHELANHTYTHPVLTRVSRSDLAGEITRCRDALERHAGTPGRWFRPSGTEVPTPAMLEEAARAGYSTVVGYDVDPHDYQDPGADRVAAAVAQALHPGAIVSLHTGHRGTVDAFEGIVRAIRGTGLHPVTVHDLLGPA